MELASRLARQLRVREPPDPALLDGVVQQSEGVLLGIYPVRVALPFNLAAPINRCVLADDALLVGAVEPNQQLSYIVSL